MQGGERGAPGQHDAGVDGRRGEGERWIRLLGGDLTQEPVAAGAASQCGAGESADPQSGQLGQVQSRRSDSFERPGVGQHQRLITKRLSRGVVGTGDVGV